MVKDQIINEIEKMACFSNAVSYTFWSIGITTSPNECCKYYNSPHHYLYWQAQDSQAALEIRDIFIKKGMKEAMGQDDAKATFVFILMRLF